MVSIIIPTYNRAHTLRKVFHTYLHQKLVSEIIVVNDGGSDDTAEVLKSFSDHRIKYIKMNNHEGAVKARIKGLELLTNNYILFCDDDEALEENYVEICLNILLNSPRVGAVSGKRIFKKSTETFNEAIARNLQETKNIPIFNYKGFCFNHRAIFQGNISVPLTSSIILTRLELLKSFGFDPFYCKGNGYREESDFQANLIINGYVIILSSYTHSIHLSRSETRTGGQRINRISRFYWNVYYSIYFYKKYFVHYKRLFPEIQYSYRTAIYHLITYQFKDLFIRPILNILNKDD
jgi:glycosyltransferase involved in cell wall biosynthesis